MENRGSLGKYTRLEDGKVTEEDESKKKKKGN